MNTIKKQLREFYTKNNIGMKRIEKLIKSDLNLITLNIRNTYNTSVYKNTRLMCKNTSLIDAFVWEGCPQGFYYWHAREYQRIVRNIFNSDKGRAKNTARSWNEYY